MFCALNTFLGVQITGCSKYSAQQCIDGTHGARAVHCTCAQGAAAAQYAHRGVYRWCLTHCNYTMGCMNYTSRVDHPVIFFTGALCTYSLNSECSHRGSVQVRCTCTYSCTLHVLYTLSDHALLHCERGVHCMRTHRCNDSVDCTGTLNSAHCSFKVR